MSLKYDMTLHLECYNFLYKNSFWLWLLVFPCYMWSELCTQTMWARIVTLTLATIFCSSASVWDSSQRFPFHIKRTIFVPCVCLPGVKNYCHAAAVLQIFVISHLGDVCCQTSIFQEVTWCLCFDSSNSNPSIWAHIPLDRVRVKFFFKIRDLFEDSLGQTLTRRGTARRPDRITSKFVFVLWFGSNFFTLRDAYAWMSFLKLWEIDWRDRTESM